MLRASEICYAEDCKEGTFDSVEDKNEAAPVVPGSQGSWQNRHDTLGRLCCGRGGEHLWGCRQGDPAERKAEQQCLEAAPFGL